MSLTLNTYSPVIASLGREAADWLQFLLGASTSTPAISPRTDFADTPYLISERDRFHAAGPLAVVPAPRHPRPTDGRARRACRQAGQWRSLTDDGVAGRD